MALIGDKGKTYGLILKGKAKPGGSSKPTEKPPSVFGEESDEDDREFERKFKSFDTRKETMKAQMKKQTQISLETVLAEDPSVFEYDSIYDAMHEEQERKTESKRSATDRRPKYMARLLKTAEERKLERELQADRKVQKELEAEGDEFRDKEKFVTASYKKKMAELRALEERRRQESMVEDAFDVTKQDGLTGFYRFMLNHPEGSRSDPKASAESHEETSGTKEQDCLPHEKERSRSPREKDRSRSPREKDRSRSPREKDRSRSPREKDRSRSPRDKDRSRSPRDKDRSRSPREKDRHRKRAEMGEEEKTRSGESLLSRRRREMAESARAMFSRRADESAVDAARARYLARRQNRSAPVEEDSD